MRGIEDIEKYFSNLELFPLLPLYTYKNGITKTNIKSELNANTLVFTF